MTGFPQQLIPLFPGATVKSSSFTKGPETTQASLVGTIAAPAATVIDFYSKALEDQGFKAVPGAAADGVASKDYLRGEKETANISVVEAQGVVTFSVGASAGSGSIK